MSQDVNDGEAAQGESDDGSSPSKEAGLLSALQAERQGRQALAVEVAELKGKIDGLATKTPPREFTRAELQQQVDDGRMTPDDSDRRNRASRSYSSIVAGSVTRIATCGFRRRLDAVLLMNWFDSAMRSSSTRRTTDR